MIILLFFCQTATIYHMRYLEKGVGKISEQPKDTNVILFPKTIDYYQVELTRMLETERYGEAVDLLRFLVQCESGDPGADDEWKALLGWLETMHPETSDAALADEEETETDIHRRRIHEKSKADPDYINRLTDSLMNGDSLDKQLLALSQLTYMDSPDIDRKLLDWCRRAKLHPVLRFKVLQTLKLRGNSGVLEFSHQGRNWNAIIEETPLSYGEFPEKIRSVADRVRLTAEVNDPTLSYFAEQTWYDFLSFLYGSPAYAAIAAQPEEEMRVWSAALHAVIQETMQGETDEEEICEVYGIVEELAPSWKQAYPILRSFIRSIQTEP